MLSLIMHIHARVTGPDTVFFGVKIHQNGQADLTCKILKTKLVLIKFEAFACVRMCLHLHVHIQVLHEVFDIKILQFSQL